MSRMLFIVLLVGLAVADLAVGATWHEEKEMFTVHWVTPVIRVVMFVSNSPCIPIIHKINFVNYIFRP